MEVGRTEGGLSISCNAQAASKPGTAGGCLTSRFMRRIGMRRTNQTKIKSSVAVHTFVDRGES
ncbi:hypothetical protein SKAU_G00071950 [Synaphobranchus kaupii]|uniref:Uncharacterized protein n=1 Tax=Synaphobranchus kaupii TaxID=118154 RepID=A0A9Q1G741_SYNKA|nr:hypothetical protein SKAU_G00071950 [Synaphobranchus kaupii]